MFQTTSQLIMLEIKHQKWIKHQKDGLNLFLIPRLLSNSIHFLMITILFFANPPKKNDLGA